MTGRKLDVPEVTQSEEGQKQKLEVVLHAANHVLGRYPPYKWSVESVHSKNIVSILHLLVGLARQFRAPVRLPERVSVYVVIVKKKDGQLIHRTVKEELTSTYDDVGMRCERDAFDTLFDQAPEKLAVVKRVFIVALKNLLNLFKGFLINLNVLISVFSDLCKQASEQSSFGSHRFGHSIS